jgi:hypothetical protein
MLIDRRLVQTPLQKIYMEKPNARGPSPSRKAQLALKERLNRKSKRPPPLPIRKKSSGAHRMIGR